MMEKIYEHADDLHVRVRKVYAKTSDPYAYAAERGDRKGSPDR